MIVRSITPEFAVSPQVRPDDLYEARRLGFRSIVAARPDDEEAGQPSIAEMRDAAAEAGLGFAAVPVRPGPITDEDVERCVAAIETTEGPVLGYCRTGARAATLWALDAADALEPDAVLSGAAAAGHDLGTLRARLAQRRADASEARPQTDARSEESDCRNTPCDPADESTPMTEHFDLPLPQEHRIPRGGGAVYVRDFAGNGPAFVLLHGFPDNGHIYDPLIPHLVAAGRRVVTLDFLGFGASDKPAGALYSFAQQLADVEAVVTALELERVVIVGHDAGGPAAVNFALNNPKRTAAVVLLNAFYGEAPGLRVPELIEVFSTPTLGALQRQFLQSPAEFGWLVDFQRIEMQRNLKPHQTALYESFLGPLINDNFTQRPSAAPAFAAMTAQIHAEIAANTARMVEFRRSPVPLHLVWGRLDPYLHVSTAEFLRSQARHASLHILEAGHWPQIDEAADVARLMLEHVVG